MYVYVYHRYAIDGLKTKRAVLSPQLRPDWDGAAGYGRRAWSSGHRWQLPQTAVQRGTYQSRTYHRHGAQVKHSPSSRISMSSTGSKGSSLLVPTKARDVAKQRGADSLPRLCAAKGGSRYTSSQQQPATSASPTSSSASSTIDLMPNNYCAFGRNPASSARINLSSACSLLLAFGCNIAVRDTRSE